MDKIKLINSDFGPGVEITQPIEFSPSFLLKLSENNEIFDTYGKISVRNLQMMRQFHLTFPNANALRSELSWTHYRSLMRVEDENARKFYLMEM